MEDVSESIIYYQNLLRLYEDAIAVKGDEATTRLLRDAITRVKATLEQLEASKGIPGPPD